ncbi:MAG: hypothetical protein BalsKO_27410 [Balneolaceae bacterium]
MLRILITILLSFTFSEYTKSQKWSQSESFDTLFVKESLSALLQIHSAGERIFIATLKSDFSYAVYVSEDNGGSWLATNSDNTSGSYTVFANADADTLYSFGSDLFGTRYLRKSIDKGNNWMVQAGDYSNFPFAFTPLQFAAVNDTLIVTSSARNVGLLKSDDGGATWNSFIEFSDNDQNKAINGLESYGDYFFLSASSNGRGLFKAHRDSTRWVNALSVDGVNASIYGFDIDNRGNIYVLTHEGIQYSEDLGETWVLKTSSELGVSETGTPTHIKVNGLDLLLAFANGSNEPSIIKIKKDFSENSEDISDGFSNSEIKTRVLALATTSTSTFATRVGLATALYAYNEGDVTTSSEIEEPPAAFTLIQNYPNPFNPSTNISFTLPSSGEVDLKVYNLLGQEVATLVNHRMNSGSHTINFDASRLASGMYIYRLVSGGFSQTKKMMLIK